MPNTQKLFHGTNFNLPLGETHRANRTVNHYSEVIQHYEAARPSNAPSRSICLFAADSPAAVATFMTGQKIYPFHIFEVQATDFQRSPFRLTHEIYNRLNENKSFDKLISEYWQPVNTWFLYEYFGNEFLVVKKVPIPNEIELFSFQISYEKDIALAKSI